MTPKRLVVTGATGGIAQALCQILPQEEYRIAAVTRDLARLETRLLENGWVRGEQAYWFQPASETTSERIPILVPVEADVSTADGATRAMEEATLALGGKPSHLAHCVGTTLLAPLHRTSEEQYRACLAANLDSSFFTLRAWVQGRLAEAEPAGVAVLFSSVVALIGVGNHEAIAAAKGGVASLVAGAAATYAGQRIRINAIAPGLTRSPATERLFAGRGAEEQITAQYPLGRYAQPADQAQALAWLLSDASDWITGQVLPVDGGFTAIRPMVRGRT